MSREKEKLLSDVRENGPGNFRMIDGRPQRARVPTLYARDCTWIWEADGRDPDSPSSSGVPPSTVETCHSDSQAEYELLSGTVIYQEGVCEDGGGNAKLGESVLAEQEEAGEGKVLSRHD